MYILTFFVYIVISISLRVISLLIKIAFNDNLGDGFNITQGMSFDPVQTVKKCLVLPRSLKELLILAPSRLKLFFFFARKIVTLEITDNIYSVTEADIAIEIYSLEKDGCSVQKFTEEHRFMDKVN